MVWSQAVDSIPDTWVLTCPFCLALLKRNQASLVPSRQGYFLCQCAYCAEAWSAHTQDFQR